MAIDREHKTKIRNQLNLIRAALNQNHWFAAEARAKYLVDLIANLPDVSKYRNSTTPPEAMDYFINSEDA